MKHKFTSFFHHVVLVIVMAAVLAQPQSSAYAATTLTVTPLTWNVIGLDSNNVNVGPNHFPIGARVCNTGVLAASNVTASFVWDSSNAYINIRPGTNSSLSVTSLAAGVCTDFYFEVEVTRNASAYDTTRSYHIAVTADAGATTGSTPTPRELYVEHLISQSRNSVTDMQLSLDGSTYSSISAGGTMTLMVGNTYWIKLVGATATNGYEQIESFINFPNTIFQVLSATTTYTAETSATLNPPYDKLYGDGCVWENDPSSLNYRSCLSTGKAGGNISVTYQVKILSVPGSPLVNPEPLSTLIYDFSGSSYHYNADFGTSARYANIVNASITKTFSPKTISPGGSSTLTYTITNPGPQAITGVNFADTTNWPAGMTVASSTVTSSGCGTPSPASLTAGATSASFSNITVAGNGTCTISITVSAATAGTYNNTTNNLFINSTIDTLSFGSDALVVSANPAPPSTCATRTTMVTWDFGTAGAPTLTPTKVSDVTVATASGAAASPGAIGTDTADGNTASSYKATNWSTSGTITPPNPPTPLTYFEFDVDTSNYGNVAIAFDYHMLPGDWANVGNNFIYAYTDTATSGAPSWASGTGYAANKGSAWTTGFSHTAATTGTTRTRFFISAAGAKDATKPLNLDNVVITGCPRPVPPTLSKAFSPVSIAQGGTSTLTFTFSNPNASALGGVSFSDTLPVGLVINTPNGLTTPSCTSGTITGQTITAAAGTSTISISGGTLSANATNCTFSVNIKGNTAGAYNNISSNIMATGTLPGGYGTSSLTVIAPPVIAKSFGVNTLITGNSTSLTFSISNPNIATTLTGVQFAAADALPGGLVVASPNGLSGTCGGGTITAVAGSSSVNLTGATLAAGATCTFSVNVTGTSVGLKTNSITVTSTNGGTGNTSTANVLVKNLTPALSLLKQVGTSASGPWLTSMTIPAGQPLWYKFTVENTGDVPLNPVTITDNTFSPTCTWDNSTTPLPVAVSANDLHISTCIVQNSNAIPGTITNTAHATGTYAGSPVNSNNDTAHYENYNFGHLPSAYTNMNLIGSGGAYHLNGTTFFGSTVTTNASDGINTATYTNKASDDGVTWTPGVSWTSGGSGSVNVTAACPSAPCYINSWFDWNRDGDFNDPGERIFTNQTVNNGSNTLTFSIPSGTVLDGSTFYSRFRIYPVIPTDPQPNGPSLNGASLLVGEIEDPFFQINNGSVPTPVTVSYFYAVRDSKGRNGDTVTFNWSTATETGNVGFNIYVKSGQQLTQINKTLIPSRVIDSLDRQDYTFSGTVKGNTFFIEDVSVLGETERHGPFKLGEKYGSQMDADKINQAAVQAEHQKKYADHQDDLIQGMTVPDAVLEAAAQAISARGTVAPTLTSTKAPTSTPTKNKTKMPTATKARKQTATATATRTKVPTATPMKTRTPVVSPTKTKIATSTASQTSTAPVSPSATSTATPTYTVTVEPTGTFDPALSPEPTSNDPTATLLVDGTSTETLEPTATNTIVPSPTATIEFTATNTAESAVSPTVESTATIAVESSATNMAEPTFTSTASVIPTSTPTATLQPTAIPEPVDQLSITFNFKVRKTGIYRVTYETLRDAGLDLAGVPGTNITLYNQGRTVPVYVHPDTDLFGPGGYIEFYAEALDTNYTDTNIYTLQVSSAPIGKIPDVDAGPGLDLTSPLSYTETLRVNNQRAYSNYAPGSDVWYDTSMLAYTTPKSWSFTFQISGLADPAAAADLELVLWGGTNWPQNPDHHVVVSVNGIALADQTFDGSIEKTMKIALPAGTLHEGSNTLKLTLPGDTGVSYDLINLDKFSVKYQRLFRAQDGRLNFTSIAQVFSVANLPSANVVVYRMDDAGLVRLENINVQAAGGSYTATFAGTDHVSTYWVTATEALYTPVLEATRLKVDLNHAAQYLIISHPDFISGLQPLIQARQAQGFTVSVVDVTDLYTQYSYGIFDPQAIKKYINYAAKNLGTQYVLLVGGDTYDYRNYLGRNSISFIPSLYVTTGDIAKFVPADPLYADLDGNNVPDLAIGRFPVRTQAELAMIVNKTLAYGSKDYGRTAVFASDAYDGVVSFKDISSTLVTGLPADWSAQSIHLDDTTVTLAQQQLLSAMNGGTALVTFTGHSGPTTWTFSNLFTTKNAAALTNAGRPFVAIQWGCWNTYYVDPVNNYLVQSLLFSGDKGAAAVMGASTLTDSDSEKLLGVLLTPRMTTPGKPIGQALQQAKYELALSHPELLDVLLGWSLMGDPALVIQP